MKICPRCRTPYTNTTATCPRDGEVLSTLPQVITDVKVPKPIKPGSVIGNYLINKKLGSGGMGAVYSASHLSLGKEVAIKILREDSAQNPKILDRFYREARALAKIEHENIIQTSDFGCTPEGLTYLVMELLLGRSLEDLLRAEKRLPVPRAIHIATQICSALGAAHQRKIIHRDLKPDNIFLVTSRRDPDFVKVLDFGIAKQLDEETNTVSQLMGTPSYMAPETGASIDERTDVYALGVIFYRMFTGVLPFEGSNVMDILYKHLVEEPRPLRDHVSTLPLHIEAAVLKALSKNKTERFASMEAFSVALCQEDEDATRLRRILPGAKDDHPLDTPLDLAAKRPDTLNTHPDEERTEELSEPNAAPDPSPPTPRRERVTLHEKPRLRTDTIPLDTEEIERVEPPIQINTGDIVLETPRPPTPTTPKKDAPLFTLSPSPVITELPTHELPMRGEVPIDTETPRNPIPIFGEVRATPPPTRARQRLLMGLVVFLLLWGVVVVVLLFSAPPKPTISAAPVPQPDTALIPAPTSAASTQPLEPASQPAPPKSLPATLEATPPAPPKKQNKQNSKKSAKKNPTIKGNPDLD